MKNYFIDLTMFGGDKDFFMSAFDEAYPITISEVEEVTEESSEPVPEYPISKICSTKQEEDSRVYC